MKPRGLIALVSVSAFIALLATGCGGHDQSELDPEHEHSHGDESGKNSAGVAFEPGKGLIISQESRRTLGVETAEVAIRNLPNEIPVSIQIFGEKHHHAAAAKDHSGCDVQGSAFVPENAAASLKSGQGVEVVTDSTQSLAGVVLALQWNAAISETEAVIGVSNAAAILRPGAFVRGRVQISPAQPVPAIPSSALLRTARGDFIYVVDGDAFLRTPVETGIESGGWVELRTAIPIGKQVATAPLQTLWLSELRATKGGGHSH